MTTIFLIALSIWSLLVTGALWLHFKAINLTGSALLAQTKNIHELCERVDIIGDDIHTLRKDIATGEDLDPIKRWKKKEDDETETQIPTKPQDYNPRTSEGRD